ncbi:MAG TPA: type VI secretion system baseplate subunit TssG [Pyrinomonadaceae bacterium]|jgi:type VI secretion system protein ImpH|nr:type VI secretion system baseplate subunit TssG [Pyrinomonadaceae bacterium]
MAAEDGRASDALAEILFDEPYLFEFFQAVRLLERMYPERVPVGRSGSAPAAEVVRFRTRASLEFPASQIHALEREEPEPEEANGTDIIEREQPLMFVNFMGMTGPLGTLPHHYTELLVERARYKDTAYWEFLDIFNHRLISLFYRAWEKYRFHVAYERGEDDSFTEHLLDLIGLGTRGLRGRLGVPDEGMLFYGGLIAQRPRSASAIAAILSDYFGILVKVKQFAMQWLALDEGNLTKLGAANSDLGVDTIVGTRVQDHQSKFRLLLGPLKFREFLRFLPGQSAQGSFTSLTRWLVGLELDFDVQLHLRADEVPECSLGFGETGPMLGWTSWLKTKDFTDGPRVVLPVRE